MFGVRRSVPAHSRSQLLARVARASRVLAKASRLRGLLIVAAVADRGIPAPLPLGRSLTINLPPRSSSARNRRKNIHK
jgi:hypothetical protein